MWIPLGFFHRAVLSYPASTLGERSGIHKIHSPYDDWLYDIHHSTTSAGGGT